MSHPIWDCWDQCFHHADLQDRRTWSTNLTMELVLRRYLELKGITDEDINDRVVRGVNFNFFAAERGLCRRVKTTMKHQREKCPITVRLYPLTLKPYWEKKLQLKGINKVKLRPSEVEIEWGRNQ